MNKDISRYELIENITSDLTAFVKSDAILHLSKDSYSKDEYNRMLDGLKHDLIMRLEQKQLIVYLKDTMFELCDQRFVSVLLLCLAHILALFIIQMEAELWKMLFKQN